MATTFPIRTFENSQGHTVTGEFVCETSDAWQVAVKGKIQLVKKAEWRQVTDAGTFNPFEEMFGRGRERGE